LSSCMCLWTWGANRLQPTCHVWPAHLKFPITASRCRPQAWWHTRRRKKSHISRRSLESLTSDRRLLSQLLPLTIPNDAEALSED
jgi:hypothetical protein